MATTTLTADDLADDVIPADTVGWTAPVVHTGATWTCQLLACTALPTVARIDSLGPTDVIGDPVDVAVGHSETGGAHHVTPGPAAFEGVEDVTITGFVWAFSEPHAAFAALSEAASMPGRITRMVLLADPIVVTTAEDLSIDWPDPITTRVVAAAELT